MVVHQPRLNHVSEWIIPVAELLEFASRAKDMAVAIMTHADPELVPGEKQCRFCNAKAVCPALKAEVHETTGALATVADFADLAQLPDDDIAYAMGRVELVEQWCKAIRAEVEARLFNGREVPGFKLVEGRRGNRAWGDEKAAEKLLKGFRLKTEEMYDLKLISPTKAEKVLKKDHPGQWSKAEMLIDRAPGKPSVAPVTDTRPTLAILDVANELRGISQEA